MNSEQIKDMHLLYNAVYNEDLREQFDEYNNTIYDDNIVEFATEYFYSHGLNDDGIDILIEELGVGEFAEFVYDIVEECTLTEARRSGRIEPVTKAGKPIGSLKGGAKASAIAAKRRQKQSERNGSDDRPSGMTAALRSQATKAAEKNQPETKSTPDKTKKGIASKIGSALKRAGEDIAITYKVAREVGKRAEKSAPVRKFWGFKDKEEVKEWVNQLVEEGYDLSDYTWDEMAEIYEDKYRPKTKAQLRRYVSALGKLHNIATGKPESNEEPKEKPKRKTRSMKISDVDIREDIYDVILSHLIEEGYAESVEQAEVIMVNMSEEWREDILDEDVLGARKGHIRSVIGKGGSSIKYVAKGGDIMANDKAANERAKATDMKRRQSSDFNSEFGEIENRRQIKKMNAKGKSGHNRSGERYDVDQPHSDASNASYDEVPTDYRARKRRASGR
jgi:hypothetical protein